MLFQGLAKKLAVWMSHGDEALELPPGFELMAKTHYAVAGIQNVAKKWYAVQFHPEVHHTPQGTQILKNFVFQICGAKPTWTPQRFIDSTIEQVKAAGWNWTRHLRAFWRRGFVGGGGSGGSRDARCEREVAPDLRLREQRSAAQERV